MRTEAELVASSTTVGIRLAAKTQLGSEGCLLWSGAVNDKGYDTISVGGRAGRKVYVHRVAYLLNVGPIPEGAQIDHRCHVRRCVNPAHLRIATSKQNNENPAGLRSDNTSGHRGVTFDRSRGKWAATVQHNGRMLNLGRFDTAEEAAEVARQKRLELFSHNDADRRIHA